MLVGAKELKNYTRTLFNIIDKNFDIKDGDRWDAFKTKIYNMIDEEVD